MDSRTAKLLAERPKGFARVIYDVKAWARLHKSTARAVSIAALFVLGLGYYTGVVVPAHQREQLALQTLAAERLTSEVSTRQVATDKCLAEAQTESDARWKAACRKRGERAGCVLPVLQTEDLERQDARGRNSCLMR